MGIIGKIKGAFGKGEDRRLADQLVDEVLAASQDNDLDIKKSETGRQLLAGSRDTQRAVVIDLVKQLAKSATPIGGGGGAKGWKSVVRLGCINALMRRKLPLTDQDFITIIDWMVVQLKSTGIIYPHFVPMAGTVKALANFSESATPSEQLKNAARRLCKHLAENSGDPDSRKMSQKIIAALGLIPELPLDPSDVWAQHASDDVLALKPDRQQDWIDLLTHCQTASAGKPTGKWLKTAKSLMPGGVPFKQFRDLLLKWFPLVNEPAPGDRTEGTGRYSWDLHPLQMREPNQDVLKGLAWCCSLRNDPDLTRALTTLCASCFKKVPGIGPRAVRLGNACIFTLGALEGTEALAQLALLKVKIRNRATQNQIAKALQAAADREGVTPEDLEEMSVPEYGLTSVGILEQPFGNFTARLTITGTQTTELVWVKADGKAQKSVPAAVKADFADELKELRANAKDIQKMLPAIRERIDSVYLQQKSWPWATWRQRYLDHPLVGSIARRLIWSIGRDKDLRSGIFYEGKLVDHSGNEIATPADDDNETQVTLWHPLDVETGSVLAWRNWLDEHLVRQPFKQAHREIYVLTEAEENTGTYSNRYAAHVLKQHQFNALCLARGWRNTLRLMVDDAYPPATRDLTSWGLRAEYWIEGIGGDFGADTTDAGTYLYLATDQVRFYLIDSAQFLAHAGGGGYGQRWGGGNDDDNPLALAEIPKLVFSEIMRDVDLFVGVASVANDANWSDGGPNGTHRDYWYSHSFGALSASATTRKEILERLLPRLKIADRAHLEGKFLVVEGTVRTYKIHLGSGNILMLPNDQYLCIVPNAAARRGTDRLFLPFEGDNVMAIILSKAFLLAADDKIKDKTILSQIAPG